MQVVEQIESGSSARTNCRKKWTVEEAALLSEHVFPGQRYELIEGDLIDKMGQKPADSDVIRMLNAPVANLFGGSRVQIQSPIRLPDPEGKYSEPEPDVVLLQSANPELLDRLACSDDIALLIEVSDTSFSIDR